MSIKTIDKPLKQILPQVDFIFSKKYQDQLMRSWLCEKANENQDRKVAVTLTLKQGRLRDDGTLQNLDETEIKRLIRNIHRRINREVFGVSARRFKHKVFMFSVIEGSRGTGKRLHIHLSVGLPDHYESNYFRAWMELMLVKLPWVHSEWEIKPMLTKLDEEYWHRYITKESDIDIMLFEVGYKPAEILFKNVVV